MWEVNRDAEVYQLIVPQRTLAHRIARHEPLSTEESDWAVRVARIAAMAERVFGEPERDWRTKVDATRRAGDEWLASGRTALLHVLSAIVPATRNILINPHHPESGSIRILRIHEQGFDIRLVR